MTANVITYRGRSAAREVGKVLSLEPAQVDRLAKVMNHFEWVDPKETLERNLREVGLDFHHPVIQTFGRLWQQIQDLPRHLGQHSGGMVICQGRLDDVVPLENASMPDRVVVQWDKDDCADMGIVKVDLLGLGMMSVLQDALELVNTSTRGAPAARAEGESSSPEARGERGWGPATSENDVSAAGCAGVGESNRRSRIAVRGSPLAVRSSQSEEEHTDEQRIANREPRATGCARSRAPAPRRSGRLPHAAGGGHDRRSSRSSRARRWRRCRGCGRERFYDIVVEVAIIRPGPIVGQMVHPYSEAAAGSGAGGVSASLARADPRAHARRAALPGAAAADGDGRGGIFRRRGGGAAARVRVQAIREAHAADRREAARRDGEAGITGEAAEEIIRSITSFALYGFPESHAASFALLVYASAYLKAHYPAAFYTAMLNNQPMGFYHPATLVKDAQRHGVRFAPIDVQESDWTCRVEPDGRVRLGLMYVNGLRQETGKAIAASRSADPGSAASRSESRALRRARELVAVRCATSGGRDRSRR